MTLNHLLQFLVCAALIWLAARWLVRACEGIAKATGLGQLFVGSLFLAASTSAPELFVDISATRKGLPDLAAGDLLGSSLVNLAIFCSLGLVCLKPGELELPRQTRFSAWLAAVLTAEVALSIFGRPEGSLLGLSLPSLAIVATYLLGIRLIFGKPAASSPSEEACNREAQRRLLARSVLAFLSGTLLIFIASPFLVSSAEAIAEKSGMGKTLIGTSLLALATSFPELSSSLTAMRQGSFKLAAGNIVGSNAMNMLIFVVMDAIWREGNIWQHLAENNLIAAAFVIFNMAILALPSDLVCGKRWIGERGKLALVLLSSLSCYGLLYAFRQA